jgi:hypothetical protein
VVPIRIDFWNFPGEWSLNKGRLRFRYSEALQANRKRLNPWKVREELLSLPETPEAALRFLNATGAFHNLQGFDSLEDFWAWKHLLRSLLKSPPRRWASLTADRGQNKLTIIESRRFQSRLDWQAHPPVISLFAWLTLPAVLGTIHLDHLRKAKIRFCARPDCRKEFELETRHRRKFCSQYCAHIESVRAMRKRQR